jgi:TnpA family transposase
MCSTLYHDTGLAIEEHYTDTGSVSTDYTITMFRKRILTKFRAKSF